jgi:hypothetical protein
VIKVKIHTGTEEKYDKYDWPYFEKIYLKGQLISVFWHPIDGPHGAVLTEDNEIQTFILENIIAEDGS